MALCPGLPGWAGTRKVEPIWILLKQERVSGSGISWAICKSTPRSRQITMPAPHHTVFYGLDALPTAQSAASRKKRPLNGCLCVLLCLLCFFTLFRLRHWYNYCLLVSVVLDWSLPTATFACHWWAFSNLYTTVTSRYYSPPEVLVLFVIKLYSFIFASRRLLTPEFIDIVIFALFQLSNCI